MGVGGCGYGYGLVGEWVGCGWWWVGVEVGGGCGDVGVDGGWGRGEVGRAIAVVWGIDGLRVAEGWAGVWGVWVWGVRILNREITVFTCKHIWVNIKLKCTLMFRILSMLYYLATVTIMGMVCFPKDLIKAWYTCYQHTMHYFFINDNRIVTHCIFHNWACAMAK